MPYIINVKFKKYETKEIKSGTERATSRKVIDRKLTALLDKNALLKPNACEEFRQEIAKIDENNEFIFNIEHISKEELIAQNATRRLNQTSILEVVDFDDIKDTIIKDLGKENQIMDDEEKE